MAFLRAASTAARHFSKDFVDVCWFRQSSTRRVSSQLLRNGGRNVLDRIMLQDFLYSTQSFNPFSLFSRERGSIISLFSLVYTFVALTKLSTIFFFKQLTLPSWFTLFHSTLLQELKGKCIPGCYIIVNLKHYWFIGWKVQYRHIDN